MSKTAANLDQDIAMDAFLSGRMSDGWAILSAGRTRLSKPQAKRIAKLLVAEGRNDDALTILTRTFGAEGAKRELSPAPQANVGDILVASWGYEQTNIDFYQVVSASGSMATIRKITGRFVGERGRGTDTVFPDPGSFVGAPKRARVQKSSHYGYSVKVNDHHAYPWTGRPEHQTSSGYGH